MLRSNDFLNSNTFRYYVCIVHYVKTIWGNRTLNTYYKLCSKHMRSHIRKCCFNYVQQGHHSAISFRSYQPYTENIWMVKFQQQPREVFYEKSCFKKFRKIHRKTPVPDLFSNKVAGLRPATLLKKSLWHRCSCEFCEIWKSTFFTEHLWTTASEISVYSES